LPPFHDDDVLSWKCTCEFQDTSTTSTSTSTLSHVTSSSTQATTTTSLTSTQPPTEGHDSSESVEVSTVSTVSSRLHIGRPPPSVIPNSNGTQTCAVLSTALRQSIATVTWLKAEEVTRTPQQVYGLRYMYAITARGCNLYYCSRSNLRGTCKSLESLEHVVVLVKFKVASYVCDCE
jgi:hypothetical protein